MPLENIEDQHSRIAQQDEIDAKNNLLDDAYPKRPTWEYIDKESTKIADLLSNAGRFANGGPESVKPAADELSAALKQLKDPTDYNDLLFMVAQKNGAYAQNPSNEVQFMGHISVENWNSKTGTWDDVTISGRGYPMTAPIRIVQPGNTLWDLSTDRLKELRQIDEIKDFNSMDVRKMLNQIAAKNGIVDPRKIYVGDNITMPHSV